MNHQQAITLFQQIHKGKELGADADGNAIHGETPFSIAKDVLGYANTHIYRTNQHGCAPVWNTTAAVAFLREWADALEVPTKQEGSS
jgi:hypothetical protein